MPSSRQKGVVLASRQSVSGSNLPSGSSCWPTSLWARQARKAGPGTRSKCVPAGAIPAPAVMPSVVPTAPSVGALAMGSAVERGSVQDFKESGERVAPLLVNAPCSRRRSPRSLKHGAPEDTEAQQCAATLPTAPSAGGGSGLPPPTPRQAPVPAIDGPPLCHPAGR